VGDGSLANVKRLEGAMTTSPETEELNHPVLRELVQRTNGLPLADRLTLLKALVPGVATAMTPRDFEGFVTELRLKGERFYDARRNPGQGRKTRRVPGERDVEGR
jgi:hypothetical protein